MHDAKKSPSDDKLHGADSPDHEHDWFQDMFNIMGDSEKESDKADEEHD